VRPANQPTIIVVALCRKKVRNPRFISSNICCGRFGHKEYLLQNITSIDTSGFCRKSFFFKLITGSCSKKGVDLCAVLVSKTVFIRSHVQAQTISGHVKRCVTLSAAQGVSARVCALQQNRFAAELALTACSVARLDAKETGVCDSCERRCYICCKKKGMCARSNTSYRGPHTAKVLDFVCVYKNDKENPKKKSIQR